MLDKMSPYGCRHRLTRVTNVCDLCADNNKKSCGDRYKCGGYEIAVCRYYAKGEKTERCIILNHLDDLSFCNGDKCGFFKPKEAKGDEK